MTDDLVERLLDWPYQGETMAHEAADRIEALTAERDRLREALEVADEYLHVLQTVNSEPLNSLNQSKVAGQYIAGIRNDAREIWAIIGNVMHLGLTVSEARAAMKGESHD